MATSVPPNPRTLLVATLDKTFIYHHLGMAPLIWHSQLIKTMFIRAKNNNKDVVNITLPDIMVDNTDIVNILCGDFQSSIYYVAPGVFENIDLVKFFQLCSYMLIDEQYLMFLLANFNFEHNDSIVPATYWAKYRMNYPLVAHKLLRDIDINPHHLPGKSNYRNYYKRIRSMTRSDRRYYTAVNFNYEYWPHYARCRCARCRSQMQALAFHDPLTPTCIHDFSSHFYCPTCPLHTYLPKK